MHLFKRMKAYLKSSGRVFANARRSKTRSLAYTGVVEGVDVGG